MASLADRNLLFGIFALQMDMISRDALIQAMNAWVLQKEQSLGAVLLSQGALVDYDVELINRIVERNVARHNGDVTLTLAALQIPEPTIHSLNTITDQSVIDTLHRLSNENGRSKSKQSPPLEGTYPSASGRFEDIKFHAEGGLGEVWKARDGELGREVAIKRIKPRFRRDEESQVRFVWEAEITGNLEHPGIVPVYSLGRYTDGVPYYAMRFIRGESLKREIEDFHKAHPSVLLTPHDLAFRRLMTSFIHACQTLHFAHSQGVLHRDIKPANIMVGSFGETLVVDWGLAKKVDTPERVAADHLPSIRRPNTGESTATQMGSAMGTPAYMSPEQAAGRWDKVGVESDVYSLGATLYHLITGDTAIREKDITKLLGRVERGDFPPPAQASPRVPRDLSAVCMKAMALKPQDRYPSARDLAEDLERWLADQEVTASAETPSERISRWLRHNSAKAYAIAAVTLVVLLSLLAVAAAMQVAAREKALAFSRLNGEREAVDMWLGEASRSLRYYPGALADREKMLEVVTRHYDALAAQKELAGTVERDQARAYLQLAEVEQLLEKHQEALQSVNKAESILSSLLDTGDESVRAEWSQARTHHAVLAWHDNQPEAALGLLTATRATLTGDERDIREARLQCLIHEGSILVTKRDWHAAQSRLDDALRLTQALGIDQADLPSEIAEARRVRAMANAKVLYGQCRLQLGHPEDARRHIEEALEHFERVVDGDARHLGHREEMALTRIALADVMRRLGRYSEAEQQFKNAIDDYEDLSAALPDAPMLQERLAISHVNLAHFYLDQARFDAALEHLHVATPIIDEIQGKRGAHADFRLGIALLLDAHGELLRETGGAEEAIDVFHTAQQRCREVIKTYPESAGERLALVLGHEAQAAELVAKEEDALRLYRESLDHLNKVKAGSTTAQNAKAMVHVFLGDLLNRQGHTESVKDQYGHAEDLWRGLVAESDADVAFVERFAWFLAISPERFAESSQEASKLADRLKRRAPEMPRFLCTRALVLIRGRHFDDGEKILAPYVDSPEKAGGYYGHVLGLSAMLASHRDEKQEAGELLVKAKAWHAEHRPGGRDLQQLIQEAQGLIGPANSAEAAQP